MIIDLPGLPPAVCLHEAAHACVARHFGLPVIAVIAASDGSGMCLLARGKEPEELIAAAVSTSAGIAFYRMAGYDEIGCDDDTERVKELRVMYREATGLEMDDTFAAAKAIINTPKVTREILATAWAMQENVVYSGAELLVMANGDPVPVAKVKPVAPHANDGAGSSFDAGEYDKVLMFLGSE